MSEPITPPTPTATFQAICPKCGGRFGHPGPCPRCQPIFGPHIQSALDLAYEAHRNEWREGDIRLPYMTHIFDILRLARRVGIRTESFDVYRAIILHDAVESGFPIERIAALSTQTADHVLELTFVPSPGCSKSQAKSAYLASFAGKSLVALVVKVLDRIVNVRDFLEDGNPYYLKYFRKATALFDALAQRQEEVLARWGDPIRVNLMVEYARLEAEVKW